MNLRLILLIVIGAAASFPAAATPMLETTRAPLRSSTAADTMNVTGTVGQTLIFTLPEEVDGREVLQYEPLRLPARSWAVDRAFFWKTSDVEPGRHEILFRAVYEGAPPVELTVVVTLEPAEE